MASDDDVFKKMVEEAEKNHHGLFGPVPDDYKPERTFKTFKKDTLSANAREELIRTWPQRFMKRYLGRSGGRPKNSTKDTKERDAFIRRRMREIKATKKLSDESAAVHIARELPPPLKLTTRHIRRIASRK